MKRYQKLSELLRSRARSMVEKNEGRDSDVSDNAELLNVLARMIEGKTVYRSFGAPGDWGYGTPIGDTLRECYSIPEPAAEETVMP